MLKIRKLDFFVIIVLLNLDKFFNLAKNIIPLFLFSALITKLFFLLIASFNQLINKNNKIYNIKIYSIVILSKLQLKY